MAVAAAKNASSAVGAGTTAAAATAAVVAAGGGAAGGAAGNASSATQAGVVVTAVAAASVVAGMAITGEDGVSLLCPKVTNPSVLPGYMAVDFLLRDGENRMERRLTLDQAAVMGSTFVETYNEMFGCQSDYNRLIINCTVPCDEPVGEDFNSTSRFCCEQLDDPLFGEILRCSFNCFVHCKGCLESEPLFETPVGENSTSTTLETPALPLNSTTPNPTMDSSNGTSVRLLQSAEYCSPQCLLGKSVEDVVCGAFFNESDSSCVAVRAFTIDSTTSPEDTSDFSIVAETGYIDAPSAQPSTAPSITGSMSPSSWPSQEPTNAPTLNPSNVPSLRPSNLPTRAPSQGPSLAPTTLPPSESPTPAPSESPTLSPTISPTRAPSASPTLFPSTSPTNDAIFDLVLYNSEGVDLGSLTGRPRIWIAQVGSELTVRAIPSDPDAVDRVDFYFDGSWVNGENIEPYYLNNDERGVGIAYPPLAAPGEHNVTALAEKDGVPTGRQTAIFQVVPNDVN